MEYSVSINGQMASTPEPPDRRDKESSEAFPTLSKLKGLSRDDKTENAMLRSRIDEQSQLIMILKARADEAIIRTQTLEKINAELTDFRENASDNLNHEIRKFNLLDKRFNDLASNHEELIKYKDEYKRVNIELRQENDRLRDENRKLFSKALLEKDDVIKSLEEKFAAAQNQISNLDAKLRQLTQESRSKEETLQKELKVLQEKLKSEIRSLQTKLNETEERLKGANYKVQNQIDSRQSASAEAEAKIQQLTKEKDELLDLAMSRGKIIQKEQTDNKQLQKKISEMEKSVRNMEEKFEREAAAVNANRQVRKLKDELEEVSKKETEVSKVCIL